MPSINHRSSEIALSASLVFALVSVFIFLPVLARAAEQPGAGKAGPPEVMISTNTTLDARLAGLASLSLDELQAKAKGVEENIPKMAEQAQTRERELRELRIAGLQNEAVLAIRQEMAALQKKIELAIDEIPEVKAKSEESGKAKSDLFQEMQFRTRLMGLIAAAEKRAAAAQAGQVKTQDARDE